MTNIFPKFLLAELLKKRKMSFTFSKRNKNIWIKLISLSVFFVASRFDLYCSKRYNQFQISDFKTFLFLTIHPHFLGNKLYSYIHGVFFYFQVRAFFTPILNLPPGGYVFNMMLLFRYENCGSRNTNIFIIVA